MPLNLILPSVYPAAFIGFAYQKRRLSRNCGGLDECWATMKGIATKNRWRAAESCQEETCIGHTGTARRIAG